MALSERKLRSIWKEIAEAKLSPDDMASLALDIFALAVDLQRHQNDLIGATIEKQQAKPSDAVETVARARKR